jgi:hypothetical protein
VDVIGVPSEASMADAGFQRKSISIQEGSGGL